MSTPIAALSEQMCEKNNLLRFGLNTCQKKYYHFGSCVKQDRCRMCEATPGPGFHSLTNGTTLKIISSDRFMRVKAGDMYRDLVLAASMDAKYGQKSLCGLLCEWDHEIIGRKIPMDANSTIYHFVYDVADALKALNPHLFTTNYGFRRALMGENQRDFMKCQELHKYDSLEYRAQQQTYRPLLSATDLLAFFSSPFFNSHSTNKLQIFEEDRVHAANGGSSIKCEDSEEKIGKPVKRVECLDANAQIFSNLDTFNSSWNLLQEMRTLKRPFESLSLEENKRHRCRDIISEAQHKTLRVMVEANVLLLQCIQNETT